MAGDPNVCLVRNNAFPMAPQRLEWDRFLCVSIRVFIAGAMEIAVVKPTGRSHVFIADFLGEPLSLYKAEGMGARRPEVVKAGFVSESGKGAAAIRP